MKKFQTSDLKIEQIFGLPLPLCKIIANDLLCCNMLVSVNPPTINVGYLAIIIM